MTYRDYIRQSLFEEVWQHLNHMYGEVSELKRHYWDLFDSVGKLPLAPTDAQILLERDALGDVRAVNTFEVQEKLIDREVVLSERVAGEIPEIAAHLLYWSSMFGFETAAQYEHDLGATLACVPSGPHYDDEGRMKKYLFLDFDGVLNSDRYAVELTLCEKPSKDQYGRLFDPQITERLKRLLNATHARIVAIGSDRLALDRAGLNAMWKKRGMPGEIDHVLNTEIADDERGKGVNDFRLEKYEPYVILDDEDTYLPEQKPFLIRINPLNGLTDNDVEQAIKILNRFDDYSSDDFSIEHLETIHDYTKGCLYREIESRSIARKRLRFWRDTIFHDSSMHWAWSLKILAGKLEYNIGYLKYFRRYVGWEYDVSRMELCCRLIDIATDDYAEIEGVYVNPGNAARYDKRIDTERLLDCNLHDLRQKKAFSLLWLVLDRNMKRWWD